MSLVYKLLWHPNICMHCWASLASLITAFWVGFTFFFITCIIHAHIFSWCILINNFLGGKLEVQ